MMSKNTLKSVEFKAIVRKAGTWKLTEPLEFELEHFPDEFMFIATYNDGVLRFAVDFPKLKDFEDELEAYIDFLVGVYVKEDVSKLDGGAKKLRERLIELLGLEVSKK